MIFYKFCSLNEWTIHNLYYNNIHFSKVDILNDSSEFSLNFQDDTSNEEVNFRELSLRISRYLNSIDVNGNYNLAIKALERWKDLLSDIAKEKNNEINDKERVALYFLGIMGELYKTSSFTVEESVLNPIMWGHYASSCTGLCVGYDLSARSLIKVNYVDGDGVPKIKTTDILKEDHTDIAEKMVSHKFKDWSYEKEYRMIQEKDILNIGDGAVKELCFGYRANYLMVKLVIDIVRQRNPDVQIFIAAPTKSNYKMVKIKTDTDNIESYLSISSGSDLGDRYLLDHSVMKSVENKASKSPA